MYQLRTKPGHFFLDSVFTTYRVVNYRQRVTARDFLKNEMSKAKKLNCNFLLPFEEELAVRGVIRLRHLEAKLSGFPQHFEKAYVRGEFSLAV